MKTYDTLAEIQRDLHAGSLSCSGLVRFYLDRIEQHTHLNLYVEVFAEEALVRAAEIDQKIAAGTAGALAGLVLGIKDVICYRHHGLTASSRILQDFSSQLTATALQRLLDEDVIVIGRHSCDEFAMGSSNENSCYGPARNPHDSDRVPGGSSGASAAAVAANLCHAALGSDTGGSVRQPAAFCGTVGIKPTYGRISRYGLIAYASSFDQIGPLTRSVEDAALLLAHMSGVDPRDQSSAELPAIELAAESKPLRIAFFEEAMNHAGLDPVIQQQMKELITNWQEAGHTVEAVSFQWLKYLVSCYYILTTAEASSNLARYDGIRYGWRSESAKDLQALYTQSRTEAFGEEVKRRIMLGTFVLSTGYYDAYYHKAQQVRALIADETERLLSQYDLLFSPTTPSPAFLIGEKTEDPIDMYLGDIFTVHANLVGAPAISLPLTQHPNGLPLGWQLMAAKGADGKLLRAALDLATG